MTFMEKVKAKLAKPSEIDDYIETWHDSNNEDRPLHEFLGMTEKQYAIWCETNMLVY